MAFNIGNFAGAVGNIANTVASVASTVGKVAQDIKGGNLTAALKDFTSGLSSIIGGSTAGNASPNAPMSKMPSMASLFGNDSDGQMKLQAQKAAAAAKGGGSASGAKAAGGASAAGGAGAAGGAPTGSGLAVAAPAGEMSLGAVLAMVGGILVNSMNNTLKALTAAAKQLDATTTSGGPTASQNQMIQQLTFNLQQVQQTLNRVNETVTNLSKSQTDAQKATTQNLQV